MDRIDMYIHHKSDSVRNNHCQLHKMYDKCHKYPCVGTHGHILNRNVLQTNTESNIYAHIVYIQTCLLYPQFHDN